MHIIIKIHTIQNTFVFLILESLAEIGLLNPVKPELTIVVFIHYKPRIAIAILDL